MCCCNDCCARLTCVVPLLPVAVLLLVPATLLAPPVDDDDAAAAADVAADDSDAADDCAFGCCSDFATAAAIWRAYCGCRARNSSRLRSSGGWMILDVEPVVVIMPLPLADAAPGDAFAPVASAAGGVEVAAVPLLDATTPAPAIVLLVLPAAPLLPGRFIVGGALMVALLYAGNVGFGAAAAAAAPAGNNGR